MGPLASGGENLAHLLGSQSRDHPPGAPRLDQVQRFERFPNGELVEELDRGQGLVLRRASYVQFDCHVRQETVDVGLPECIGISSLIGSQESTDPMQIRLQRLAAVVTGGEDPLRFGHQLRGFARMGSFGWVRHSRSPFAVGEVHIEVDLTERG